MDYGKRIKLTFQSDGGGADLYDIVSAELITKFRLKEVNYNTYIYPTSVAVGANANELYLNFEDFNQAQPPYLIEYLGGTSLKGLDFPVLAFTITPTITNLNRQGDYEYLELASIDVAGTNVLLTFLDGFSAEHLELSAISVLGENAVVAFENGYLNEYLELSTIAAVGTYADASGVPV